MVLTVKTFFRESTDYYILIIYYISQLFSRTHLGSILYIRELFC